MKITFPINTSTLNDEVAVEAMKVGLNKLIDEECIKGPIDEVLVGYEIQPNTGYAIAELKEDSLIDGSKLNSVGAGLYENPIINEADLKLDEQKTFSIQSIQERLKLASKNPKLRMRYMILDYKRFVRSKKSKLDADPEMKQNLRNMFLTDMSGLMMEILPFIEEGKQLNQLIGVSQVSPTLASTARELSLIYRRALKQNKTQGQIPKAIFSKLKEAYSKFMMGLVDTIFDVGGSKESTAKKSTNKSKKRKYSYSSDGRIKLFSEPEIVEDSEVTEEDQHEEGIQE